jgi:hypothetical protein
VIDRPMSGDEKLSFVRDQMLKIWESGKEGDVTCPYCFTVVKAGKPPCCETLWRAVDAIIDRIKLVDTALSIRKHGIN